MTSHRRPVSLSELAALAHDQGMSQLAQNLDTEFDDPNYEAAMALMTKAMIAMDNGNAERFSDLVAKAVGRGFDATGGRWHATEATYDLAVSVLLDFSEDNPEFVLNMAVWLDGVAGESCANLARLALAEVRAHGWVDQFDLTILDQHKISENFMPPHEAPDDLPEVVETRITNLVYGLHLMLGALTDGLDAAEGS